MSLPHREKGCHSYQPTYLPDPKNRTILIPIVPLSSKSYIIILYMYQRRPSVTLAIDIIQQGPYKATGQKVGR